MKYLIETQTTVKARDINKFWMNSDIVGSFSTEATSLKEALEKYRSYVDENYCISISDSALKNKHPMYVDLVDGDYKQVGYVITGKTFFSDRGANYEGERYIDLWLRIDEIKDVDFNGEFPEKCYWIAEFYPTDTMFLIYASEKDVWSELFAANKLVGDITGLKNKENYSLEKAKPDDIISLMSKSYWGRTDNVAIMNED